jgi:hypothetical protein
MDQRRILSDSGANIGWKNSPAHSLYSHVIKHTYIHPHARVHKQAHTHIYTREHDTRSHIFMRTHTHKHARTHANKLARTRTLLHLKIQQTGSLNHHTNLD